MEKNIFPERRADGSFCIEITVALSVTDESDIGSVIQGWWLNEWTPMNKKWIRVWNRGHTTERTEVLQYDDEFRDAPQVVCCEGSELKFHLLGKNSAKKLWKDWLVSRIIPDLTARFPAIGKLIGVENCN